MREPSDQISTSYSENNLLFHISVQFKFGYFCKKTLLGLGNRKYKIAFLLCSVYRFGCSYRMHKGTLYNNFNKIQFCHLTTSRLTCVC